MILAITHPKVESRDCAHCQSFIYNEATGEPEMWEGKPYRRGKVPTPCQTDVGCPKGSPDAGIALSDRNRMAWNFNRRCKAVGRWPEDPIVEMNAAIIAAAEADGEVIRERERARRQRPANP
ncbi:hypothetical protein K2D_16930 [Planctomycetes bacterium K2D]|nr:hypothetical protein K2D_16930 [Planctomycetes bacterium K2D]